MNTPIRAFWKLFEKIDQISAEEDMRKLRVSAASSSGDSVKRLHGELTAKYGRPVIIEEVGNHSAGIARLRELAKKS